MPKVSVVMPVYNGEAFLREAIESILGQTFTDWELIIVSEFGTSQESADILREYAELDERIRVIQNQERKYIAESLNIGLWAAAGKYIARMDADDIAGEKRLEVQTAYMDAHPEIDVCGLKVTMLGKNVWDWAVETDPEYLRCACLFYTPFVHPTVMMRAGRLREFGLEYDPAYHYTEDFEFFTKASEFLRYTNIERQDLYYYRYYETNATNVGGETGRQLYCKVMEDSFSRYGLRFRRDEMELLSPHLYPHARSTDEALDHLTELDLLLKEIFLCDALRERFGAQTLFSVLHRKWMDAYERNRWNQEVMSGGLVQKAVERGLFRRPAFYEQSEQTKLQGTPIVSIVLPAYNSEAYILDTVFSLLTQDFSDFELLIVNEFGSDDRTLKCISLFRDDRIRVIQNENKLGLAESLNLGFSQARGKYIARADADDIYPPNRLSTQVKFMTVHPDIAICGSWQRHFGKRDLVHMPPESPEEMKAELLFKCDVCHSTVIIRKKDFTEAGLFYDPAYLSEDYELWTRAARRLKFATIPQILGEYRWTGDNITEKKMDRLDTEAQGIVARSLKENLGMEIPASDLILLSGWKNPFRYGDGDREELCRRELALLREIEERNRAVLAYAPMALQKVLEERLAWAGIKEKLIPFSEAVTVKTTEVSGKVSVKAPKKSLKDTVIGALKRILKPLYRPFRKRYEDRLIKIESCAQRQDGAVRHLQQTVYDLDGHLYDYYEKQTAQQDGAVRRLQQTVYDLDWHLSGCYEKQTAQQDEAIRRLQQIVYDLDGHLYDCYEKQTAQQDEAVRRLQQTIYDLDGHLRDCYEKLNVVEETLLASLKESVQSSEKNILQTMDGRVWKAEENILRQGKNIQQIQTALALEATALQKRIFLIGTPEHNNIGDAAIVVGEMEFIRRYFPAYRLIEVPDNDLDVWYESMVTQIGPEDILCLQGGGNMGSRYLREETVRRCVVRDFTDRAVTVLPQTAFYEDSEAGRKELAYTAGIFGRHPALTILTRGDQSLRFVREQFPQAKSACVPDMALMLDKDYGLERKGILLCIRSLGDESGLTGVEYDQVVATVRRADPEADITDNLHSSPIFRDMRRSVVEGQLRRFAARQVIVTDRLHGLIFALITHTPCVVLSSYNYKIGEFCRTFVRSDGVFFLDTDVSRLEESIRKAMEHGPLDGPGVDMELFELAQRLIREGEKP